MTAIIYKLSNMLRVPVYLKGMSNTMNILNTQPSSWLTTVTVVSIVVLLLTLAALALVWVGAPVTPGSASGGACHHTRAWWHSGHRGAVITVSWTIWAWVQVQLLGQVPTSSISRWAWWSVLLLTTSRHCSRPHRCTPTLQILHIRIWSLTFGTHAINELDELRMKYKAKGSVHSVQDKRKHCTKYRQAVRMQFCYSVWF